MSQYPLRDEMMAVLHELIPSSVDRIPAYINLTAESVYTSLSAAGIPFDVVRLPTPITGDWDLESSEYGDDDILKLIDMSQAGHEGELLIETYCCSAHDKDVCRCHSCDFKQFVSDFQYMVFNSDAIIVCKQSSTLTIFHHEGVYSHVKL